MAERLSESRTSYTEWEKNTIPRADLFFKIAKVLQIEPADLIKEGWEPDESSSNSAPKKRINKTSKASLETIQTALDRVLEQQISTRAEVRSYGQYQVSRDAKGDQNRIVKILAEIGMLVAEHEAEISKGDNLADNGN